MAEASISVDLYNPGQVFACLGFLEAAEILLGDAEGGFNLSDESASTFSMRASGKNNPFHHILEFVQKADIFALSPSDDVVERDKGPTKVTLGLHPCRIKSDGKTRNAVLPVAVQSFGETVEANYWCDYDTGRPRLQLWSPTNGNSSYIRFTNLHDAFHQAAANAKQGWHDNPFALDAPVDANFHLELRRNWTSMNLGFSLDKIKKQSACVPLHCVTYPAVELLAAVGLTNARPAPTKSRLEWRYAAWGMMLIPSMARAALGVSLSSVPQRMFRMYLESPNDRALSIANAKEEL